ncbi:TBP family protein [Halobiforma nitratireducens]|uniref:Transcription factor n=1 Tax=Halobiforma nitratireducens JCM 10879 TaxID=1227454 RepID=M0LUV7_9EURY|nr:transcription factor [Halobiforma nitratireducens]EMA37241.1 transcription factor [Halobiforma nitratireducens JCM 10879]
MNEVDFTINNIVAKASIGREIELNALAEDLEKGEIDYSALSQRLTYRFPKNNCTIVLFRTGQAMLMGSSTIDAVDTTWKTFEDELQVLLQTEE